MVKLHEPVTALVNAAVLSLDECGHDQSSEIVRAAQFHQRLRAEQTRCVVARIDNAGSDVLAAITEALLESGAGKPLHERRIYHEFQRIVVEPWTTCEWDEMEGVLRVDEQEYRVPQSSDNFTRELDTYCVGLTPEEIEVVRAYVKANEGPWNFRGCVRDFRAYHGVVWAVDWGGDRIAAIQPDITPSQFLRKYARQIDGLTAEEQKTLLFALTDSDSLLLKRQFEFTLIGGSRSTGVVIASYIDETERKYVMLTRPQTSAEFLRTVPVSGFEFSLAQEDVYASVVEYVSSHKGPWNQKGLVTGFFEDALGAVRCRLIDDSSAIIPLRLPFATFMTTYVDDNPKITPSGRALINRLAETVTFDFVRGSIKSIFGSAEHGVLVEGHDEQIIRAFFDEWSHPVEEISADPFLSNRAKQAVMRDIAENPKVPDWRCQGYVTRIREEPTGVLLIRYDGSSRHIPFAVAI